MGETGHDESPEISGGIEKVESGLRKLSGRQFLQKLPVLPRVFRFNHPSIRISLKILRNRSLSLERWDLRGK